MQPTAVVRGYVIDLINKLRADQFFIPYHGMTPIKFYESIGLGDEEDQRQTIALCLKRDVPPTLPTFYASTIYNNGPMIIQRFEVPIPQSVVNANKKLIFNGLNAFMPIAIMDPWIKQYAHCIDNDLVAKYLPTTKAQLNKKLKYFPDSYLDNTCSFLEENRSRFDRNLYTFEEATVANNHPDYPALILAMTIYRSMVLEYLDFLIATARSLLPDDQMKQFEIMVNNLRPQFSLEDNFNDLIIGIIRNNHIRRQQSNNEKSLAVTREDIHLGLQFNTANGAFRRNLICPYLQSKIMFTCPGKTFVLSMLNISFGREEDNKSGKLIFELFTKIKSTDCYQKDFSEKLSNDKVGFNFI